MSTKITFLSKQERERIRAEKEKQEIEAQKRIEEANKKERREMLKMAGKSADPVHKVTVATPEQLLAQAAANVQASANISAQSAKARRNRVNFDWDETEDTLNSDDIGIMRKRRDPLLNEEPAQHVPQGWTQKLTSEMTERDWKIFREDHEISVSGRGRNIPHPFRSWTESGLPKELLDAVYKAGYTRPTPIQMQSIPIAIQGSDIIGLSSTGSGKTAAFILPMLTYIRTLPPITATAMDGPYALVLAPSRELALQIESEAKKFASFCNIKSCCIVGGKSAEQQTLTLSQGVELIVATPGRLADSLDAKQTVLNQCFYVVLDEADKMIDLGFESFVGRILDSIPATNLKPLDDDEGGVSIENGQYRITQMFSATMPPSVEKLTRKYLRNPITISVGSVGRSGKPEIEQRVEFVTSDMDKKKLLLEILSAERDLLPMMVFVNSKRQGDFVGTILNNAGITTTVLHSGKIQDRREEAINDFKAGRADVLVSTDVAGRGIDIPNVQHVINYDMPKSIEDYTHRIGRTARGVNKKGVATSFVLSKEDDEILPALKQFLLSSKQIVPSELQEMDYKRQKRANDDYIK